MQGFITRQNANFMLDGRPVKFIGANQYNLLNMPKSDIIGLLAKAKLDNLSVFRFWALIPDFLFLDYPLGPNLITEPSFEGGAAGWVLGNDCVRTNANSHDGQWSVKQTASYGTYDRLTRVVTVTPNTNYVWTFWHNITALAGDGSHFPPVSWVGDDTGDHSVVDGGIIGATGKWTRRQVRFNSGNRTWVRLNLINYGGQNITYYDDFNLCVEQTPVLSPNEDAFVKLDNLYDAAEYTGIYLLPSFADNPTFNTKATFVSWANTLYNAGLSTAWPYVGFFTSPYCRKIYKDFYTMLAGRRNTVNGKYYVDNPQTLMVEIGNELRIDLFTSENGTQNTVNSENCALMRNYVSEISSHMKSVDPNHLVSFGDMSHMWRWVQGDTVANGSGYGVDGNMLSSIPTIDCFDFHMYPTQADPTRLQKYGQHLGSPDAVTVTGWLRQIKQGYIATGKNNGKPVVCSEYGMTKEYFPQVQGYPFSPRARHYEQLLRDFFEAGGDMFLFWSYSSGNAGYEICADGTDGNTTNINFNDNSLLDSIRALHYRINGQRVQV